MPPLSEEDKKYFNAHMRGVTPLKQKGHASPAAKKQRIERQPRTPIPYTPPALSDFIAEPLSADSLLRYRHPDCPQSRFKALQRGEIPRQAYLDLHNLQREAARDRLSRFIARESTAGMRCIGIIHGKGGQDGKAPVIKNLVHRWLPQFPEVLAFHSALAHDGGAGAVYVLLKRRRNLGGPKHLPSSQIPRIMPLCI